MKLLQKRIFVASAERIDTRQLELEFAHKQAELTKLATQLGTEAPRAPPPPAPPAKSDKPKVKPKGRRDVSSLPIPEERFELLDPTLEGKAERIEESYHISWRKAAPGALRGRARQVPDRQPGGRAADRHRADAAADLRAPSLLALVVVDKFCDGLPLHRHEQRFAREGLDLDRGTMCRWVEDFGNTVCGVVQAAEKDAFDTAFCISTYATGIGIQPEPSATNTRQPCRRGHFFVMIADRDHVLFEFVPHETSVAVRELFRGYSGYMQADAKNTYDLLFQKPPIPIDGEHPDVCHEVGCWSHCRRKFYEAAIGKDATAREGLWRIHKLFELEERWKDEPPAMRKELRDQHSRPLLDAFFIWADAEYVKVKNTRGMLRSPSGNGRRSGASSRTGGCGWTTTSPSASRGPSPWAGTPGSLWAATSTPKPPRTSSAWSPRPSCTGSTPRRTCGT